MPTITAPSGTSFVTTALAPTRARVDGDGAEDLCPRTDDDVIREGRVALAGDTVRGIGAAERHALIDGYIVADFGGLADHHAEAVIDEQMLDRKSKRLNSSH